MLALPTAVQAEATTQGAPTASTAKPIRHSTTVNGARITYEASLDVFPVAEPGHTPSATVTTISYSRTVTGKGASAPRPVVFAFNGGPGASSIFLHMGVLGPERIDIPGDVRAPVQPRYPLVRNDESILDRADLVLIDPPGTGFSQAPDEKARPWFYSVNGDGAAVAEAIERWSHLHGRVGAPKYILGESYGAVRAVEVANVLATRPETGHTLAGIILVSPSLAIVDTLQRRSNILGYALGLKLMAATSWYHEKAGRGESLSDFAQRAAEFSAKVWLPALLAGTGLDEPARQRVAAGLESFTGIAAKYFLDHDLYLSKSEYRRLLLADRGLILGESDSRYTGPSASGADPSEALTDSIKAAAADLLRSQLGLRDVSNYRTQMQIRDWVYIRQPFDIYNRDDSSQLDYVGRLLKAMANKADMRLFIAGGWFDTTASVGAQDYQSTRAGLDLTRVITRSYTGGHMFYTDPEMRRLFAKDLREFVSVSCGAPPCG